MGTKVSIKKVKRLPNGKLQYAGYTFDGYNKPRKSRAKNKKKVVLAKVGSFVMLIHYGDSRYSDYTRHKDKERRKNYRKRSGGIRDKSGKLTRDNKFSANYWARNDLW